MFDPAPYLGFAVVSLMMAISPGPSWIYTISTTLGHGRFAGMIGNLGNSSGILFHAVAATAGLSALLSYSSVAFHALKLAGASYLIYLGIKIFRGRGRISASPDKSSRSYRQIYTDGALVNILNPKMLVLFIALLPQFVAASSGTPKVQIAIMGVMHAVIACAVHSFLVFFSSTISSKIGASGAAQKGLKWATGTLLGGFGIRMVITDPHWRTWLS